MSRNVHKAYVSSRSQQVWHNLLQRMPQSLILREELNTPPTPSRGTDHIQFKKKTHTHSSQL